ncbi:hypothetical protein EW145_g5950 [Phellinidium pouzarii]|uniref:DASH complex subunit DAD1 n=1 Tax=Phellinidium pouzarii TaxID=167371 RepID=A0A4S4KY77_9AGAM|nr:hypothetical protein EW145_g5950 [Phellinidium pouzarii]
MPDDEQTFFDRERDRLAADIASGFEHLLTASNLLNRKLEEVLGMTKEYDTISALWSRFHALMRAQGSVGADWPGSSTGTGTGAGSNTKAGIEDESLVAPLHDTTVVLNPHAPVGLPGTGGYTLQVPPSARKAPDA